MPPVQMAVLFAGVGQTLPQAPQLLTSLLTLVSQPLVCLLLSQSAKPALQTPLQTPLAQLGVILLDEQTMPHPPQLLTSLLTLVQVPLQLTNPLVQHSPLEQTWPFIAQFAHATPLVPHALLLVPGWQMPLVSQQPLEHGLVALQVVVQVPF